MGFLNFCAGLVVAVVTAGVQSFGVVLQRRSHYDNRFLPADQRIPELRSVTWITGVIAFLLSQIVGSVIALALLPALVLAPLGSFTVVFNAFFAAILVDEPLNNVQRLGSLLVTAGSAVFAFVGYAPDPELGLSEILVYATHARFVLWIGIQFAGLFVLASLAVYHRQVVLAAPAAQDESPHDRRLGMLFGLISGILTAQSFLLGKCAVELLKASVSAENQFRFLGSWLVYGLVGAYGVLTIVAQNEAMRFYDVTLVVPFSFSCFVVFSTINSLTFLQQWSVFTAVRYFILGVSLIAVITGVALVAMSARLEAAKEGRTATTQLLQSSRTPAV